MQHTAQKPESKTASIAAHGTDNGSTAIAIAPPAYGIDSVDQQTIQRKAGVVRHVADTPPANHTGLPDNLKAGIENLSGLSADDVRVHYDSSQPAQFQALAYTQGTEIYVGPGQERHLPHEAWHVVQQKLGRVKPTLQYAGVAINDDEALERDADVMAKKAIQMKCPACERRAEPKDQLQTKSSNSMPVIQRTYDDVLNTEATQRALHLFKHMVGNRTQRDQLQSRIRAQQQESVPNSDRIAELKRRKDGANDRYHRDFQVLKVWYRTATQGKELTADTVGQIEPAQATADHPLAKDFIFGAKHAYAAEGAKQYGRAKQQAALFLGNRSQVADEAEAAQILNTNIWSWGVNQAFIEGGAARDAAFVVHTEIGDGALEMLTHMTGGEFLTAIAPTSDAPDGIHRNLWHSKENRPTWYALELAGLLDLGYRLNDERSRLVPPRRQGKITPSTEKVGTQAYLVTEGIVRR